MASKYLSTGTAGWTASTRTIAGATMSAAFESADAVYQRQVMFRIGASVYYGRVESYVSGSSVVLLNAGSLPLTDGTIAELFLLDLSEMHSYQHFIIKIKAMIKDAVPVLSDEDIDLMLAQAVVEYSNDKPFFVRKKIAGNGTNSYSLSTIFGSLWKEGFSIIKSVEYPFGGNPPFMLDDDAWMLYDDGTWQDGSNKILRFTDAIPGVGEYFVVELRTEMKLPAAGAQNFPDTDEHFTNITLLAAEHCCLLLSAHYAQSSDSTISADVVNHNDRSRKYSRLAWLYKKRYNRNVFGKEDIENSNAAAMTDKDIDLGTVSGGEFLFHTRR